MSTTIIAELGINHNGHVDLACQMASMAKTCGADVVKLQFRHVESCYTQEQLDAQCKSPWGTTVDDKVRGRELSYPNIDQFNAYSCFDLESLDWIHKNYPGRPFNKVPSGMAIPDRIEYLEAVASQQRLTIISTGLCESFDIIDVVARIFELAYCPYVLNHCCAMYPATSDRLDMRVVATMRDRYLLDRQWRFCTAIGYSGHETGIMPSVLAVSLGATYIERHFTLDRAMYGADQAASLEPEGLRRLVRDVKLVPKVLGHPTKSLQGDEKQPIGKFVGRSQD